MATRVTETIECDLDGEPNATTVTYAVGSAAYEIDLCDKHGQEFGDALNPFTARARIRSRTASGAKRASAAPSAPAMSRAEVAVIRAWGEKHGFTVSNRGRLAGDLVAAYTAAYDQRGK